MEVVTDFLFLGSKITFVAVTIYILDVLLSQFGDCSHEIRRHLLLGRKAMTNLDRVLKNRDIPLLTKACSQGYGAPSGLVCL